VHKQLNWALAKLHAQYLGVRPTVWFAHDIVSPGQGRRRLPSDDLSDASCVAPLVVRRSRAHMKPEDTQHVGPMQICFLGCICLFNDNIAPQVGMVNNGECVGVVVWLHDGEVEHQPPPPEHSPDDAPSAPRAQPTSLEQPPCPAVAACQSRSASLPPPSPDPPPTRGRGGSTSASDGAAGTPSGPALPGRHNGPAAAAVAHHCCQQVELP
jgi:hypothetical protein